MANKQLATYLNNHLTASEGALELLSSLEEAQDNLDVKQLASELRAEIKAEQQALKNLMDQLQITKNKPRQAIGWLGEKFTQVKLQMDDSKDGALYLLELLELMIIAIEGKHGLWRVLAATGIPGLPAADYERYAQQSREQQQRVETFRLAAAKQAFAA
jgi:hypothetical protein